MTSFLPSSKRASIAVITIGLLLALMIFFGALIQTTTRRQYSARRLTKILLAREFSHSLALLACHQLKNVELQEGEINSGSIVEALARPFDQMPNTDSGVIALDNSLNDLVRYLKQFNTELDELSYNIQWVVNREDFRPISTAYPREKKGYIRLPVAVTYRLPGSKESITENYLYTVQTTVSANMVPVLSKFTLYINDALAGEDADRFNIVVNDNQGNVKNESQFKTWILNNGIVNYDGFINLEDLVSSPRGLIYLGGGRINLGLSRAWNPMGTEGEGFHFYAEGRGLGFRTFDRIGNDIYIVGMDTGLADLNPGDPHSVFWHGLISEGFANPSQYSSLFRLFGNDFDRTPTLVFGDVYSKTLLGRAFRSISTNIGNPLPYAGSEEQFQAYISGLGEEEFEIWAFHDAYRDNYGSLDVNTYNEQFASCLIEQSYNRALGYIITNHQNPWPLDSGLISNCLSQFISDEAIENKTAHDIPEPFNVIYDDINDLTDMTRLLFDEDDKPLANLLVKISSTITIGENQTLNEALERAGFLNGNDLDLNRWIEVNSDSTIVVDENINLVTHGGIIIPEGDIRIRNQITSDSDKIVNIVALNGNIIIDSSFGGTLDAGLTAYGSGANSGQVRLEGSVNAPPITINGNIAMRRLSNSLDMTAARGIQLNYHTDLAALPMMSNDEGSEHPLLMFAIQYPMLVD